MPHKEFSESAARRAARRVGLLARKSRRGRSIDNLGGYQVLDPFHNAIVAGEKFDLTPGEVVAFCKARSG